MIAQRFRAVIRDIFQRMQSAEDGQPPVSSCWLVFTVVCLILAADWFKSRCLLLAS